MKDYRLRIGMRFVQQGREFVIEGPHVNLHAEHYLCKSACPSNK